MEICFHNYQIINGKLTGAELGRTFSVIKTSDDNITKNSDIQVNTFAQLQKIIETYNIPHIENTETFFRHKPQVEIRTWENIYTITQKNFKPFTIRKTNTIEYPNIEWLRSKLTADEYLQYIGERLGQ